MNQEQLHRTLASLQKHNNVTSRDALAALVGQLDKREGPEALKYVGDVREDVIEELLALSEEGWYLTTGLPVHEGVL